MSESRDWLVLSVKQSRGSDWLVWYKTADAGYTSNLLLAGRYTKEEALARQAEDVTAAVPLADAMAESETRIMVDQGELQRFIHKGRYAAGLARTEGR